MAKLPTLITHLTLILALTLPAAAHQRGEPHCEQWRPLVEAFFKPEDVQTALEVIYHESTCNKQAKNGQHLGLFQFSKRTWKGTTAAPLDWRTHPAVSIWAAARLIYDIPWGGWKHWAVCEKSHIVQSRAVNC